jgi:hypothetical protein
VFVGGGVQPAKHLGFGVRLPDVDLEADILAGAAAQVSQIGVRGAAVDLRLARAEAAQVGAVQDVHPHDETSR